MSTAAQAFDAAVMMMRAGRRDEAAELCWEIMRQDASVADAPALLARIESDAGRYRNAMLYHGIALKAGPNRYDLWCNRGIDAMSARMFIEAEESFWRSLGAQESFEGHFNYGNLLCTMMRIKEAIHQYEQAFPFDKHDNAQLRVNYGEALMAVGDWKAGFKNYRHRFNAPGFPPAPRLNYPVWNGEPLEGKTILLFSEQGFGDEIQSLRFCHSIRMMGAHVILAVRPPMFRMARSLYANPYLGCRANDVILMYDQPPSEPDYQCALLDVPAFVDMTPETVPCKDGYLNAPDRGFRLEFPPGLNIGVCWSSGKRDLQPHVAETARQKSLSFDQLVRPLARPGVNLYSLQQSHNDDAAMRELGVTDPMAGVTDFADTAFIIDHLDLVITVDTSVAHLAGAMGKPVWNLVRFDALWPWMQQTRETCWYDSMTIYRQSKPLDWAEPLKRMHADFHDMVEKSTFLRAAE
jgi:tetratricopeptide (TPR) repeat protein